VVSPVPHSTLWRELLHRAALEPRARVVQGSSAALTADELVAAVECAAATLRRTAVRTLALRADNGPAWIVIDLACQLAGVCLVPLPLFFAPQPLAHVFAPAGIDAVAAAAPAPRPPAGRPGR
jgi:long-subunit acyl-CoA synthetase (AMP-forming)